MPEDPREIPDVISQALSELRLAGVDGPYSVLLSADVYTKVSETSDHGYPIREHLNRLVDGDIIWAPAIDGAFVLTTEAATSTYSWAPTLQSGTPATTRTPCASTCRRR